jgi:hypothetical protein
VGYSTGKWGGDLDTISEEKSTKGWEGLDGIGGVKIQSMIMKFVS